jgi:hypothetical protein
MSNKRTGRFGEYYGSYYSESKPLTLIQMQTNAKYIYSYLSAKGWALEAICGVLGNMYHESTMNPGRWQSDSVGNTSSGYSLVQWTPATRYLNWCEEQGRSDPSEMDNALDRISYELDNNLDYYPTDSYPLTFKEFSKSTADPYYLACTFAWNYERSAVVLWGTPEEQELLREARGNNAAMWYSFLGGTDPTPPGPDPGGSTKKKSGYKFVLFNKRRRMFT